MNCPRRKSELSTRHWNSTQKEQLKSMEIKNTKKITNIAKTFSKNPLQFVAVLGWFVGRGEAPMSPKSRKASRPSSVRIKFPACGSAWTKPVKTKLDTHAWWKCWNWWSKMWANSNQFELEVVHMLHVWLVRPPQPYPEIQNVTECIETYSNQLPAQTEANRSCAQLVLFSKDPPSSSSLPHFLFLAAFFHGSTPRSSDFVPVSRWSHNFRIQKGLWTRPFTGEVQDTCGALGSRELWQPFRSCDERQKAMLLQKELSIIRFVMIIKLFENTSCNFISYLPRTKHSWAQLLAGKSWKKTELRNQMSSQHIRQCLACNKSRILISSTSPIDV